MLQQDIGWPQLSPSCPPAAAVTAGAVPPLNGGYSVVSSATFQAGGAEWNYTREWSGNERLECVGPLNTSVDIQVNKLLRCHSECKALWDEPQEVPFCNCHACFCMGSSLHKNWSIEFRLTKRRGPEHLVYHNNRVYCVSVHMRWLECNQQFVLEVSLLTALQSIAFPPHSPGQPLLS